jgi:hypothetical protein
MTERLRVRCFLSTADSRCEETFDLMDGRAEFAVHAAEKHGHELLGIMAANLAMKELIDRFAERVESDPSLLELLPKDQGSHHRAGETDIPPGALLSPKVGPSAGDAAGATDLDA